MTWRASNFTGGRHPVAATPDPFGPLNWSHEGASALAMASPGADIAADGSLAAVCAKSGCINPIASVRSEMRFAVSFAA